MRRNGLLITRERSTFVSKNLPLMGLIAAQPMGGGEPTAKALEFRKDLVSTTTSRYAEAPISRM